MPEDIKAADALNLQNRNQHLIEIPLSQCMNIKTLVPKLKRSALEHVHIGSFMLFQQNTKVAPKVKGFASVYNLSCKMLNSCAKKRVKLIYHQMHSKIVFPLKEKRQTPNNKISTNLQDQGVSLFPGVAWLC